MSNLIQTPALPAWAQQLAGIIPLAALVEFIDVSMKLHIFELAGSVSLWNWPITPSGARLLLSKQDMLSSCCLDHIHRSPVLHCIDGRYGDWYPSNAPTTTRLYASLPKADISVSNKSPNMTEGGNRRQQLRILYLSSQNISPSWPSGSSATTTRVPLYREFFAFASATSIKCQLVSAVGWMAWIGLISTSGIAGWYFAAVYLLIMPITGLVIYFTHGGKPRRPLEDRKSSFDRLVVATNSLNGCDWLAFFGRSDLVNSLLNKPLYRSRSTPAPRALRALTQLLIMGQWSLAVASCALQDWNAFVISGWVLFCAVISAYAYPAEESARDWLTESCSIENYQIRSEFSSRRAMLTALLYLNPDSCEGRTSWINPILADSIERKAWEAAVLAIIRTGSSDDGSPRRAYWWKYVDEGLEVGKEIERTIKQLHPSSTLGPVNASQQREVTREYKQKCELQRELADSQTRSRV